MASILADVELSVDGGTRTAPELDEVERTQLAYARGAAQYAALGRQPGAMSREIGLFAAYLADGARVLDLGCGPGRDLAEMAARGFYVTGVDTSLELLAMVPQGIETVLADMREVPLDDASFDGVWANASLLHLPRSEMPGALAEVWRLLRPGGHFYISVKEGQGEAWVADRGMEERFFAYYGADELDRLLEDSGFVLEYSEAKATGGASGKAWLTRIVGKPL